uniref:Ion transport domain-containing protein n=1 Tax=Arcella intermedia TaxID=1963864 RepID=A0A6B2L8C3_9EUKA
MEDFKDTVGEKKKLVAKNNLEWIFYTMTKGHYFSKTAFVYMVISNIVILMATITILVSTLPEYWEHSTEALDGLESFSVAFFTFDYVLRLISVPETKWRWAIQPMQIIDLLSIVPYYVELILANTRGAHFVGLSVLRIFRTLWAFKIARFSKLMPLFTRALVKSKDGFALFFMIMLIVMVIVSGMMFFAEQTISQFDPVSRIWLYPDGSISHYQSIPDAFWWFMVTVTTVGYGDAFPKSQLGRAVAVCAMLLGILVIAVPVAVFGVNFTTAWNERRDEIRTNKFRQWKRRQTMNTRKETTKKLGATIQKRFKDYSIRLNNLKEQMEELVVEELELRELVSLSLSLTAKASEE